MRTRRAVAMILGVISVQCCLRLALATDPPPPPCCHGKTIDVDAPEEINCLDECDVTVDPCDFCGSEVTLTILSQPGGWELEADGPCADSRTWKLRPIGTRGGKGCIKLLARHTACDISVNKTVKAVSGRIMLPLLIIKGYVDENLVKHWQTRTRLMYIKPGSSCDSPLVSVTATPANHVSAAKICTGTSNCSAEYAKISVTGTQNTAFNSLAEIQLEIASACGGPADLADTLRVIFKPLRVERFEGESNGTLGGGGPWPPGGFGTGGYGNGGLDGAILDDNGDPVDIEAYFEAREGVQFYDEGIGGYRDPCDPLDPQTQSAHQTESTWCWVQTEYTSIRPAQAEFRLAEAPPKAYPSQQVAAMMEIAREGKEDGRDLYGSFVCKWWGFGDPGNPDPRMYSGGGKLFELNIQALSQVFNPAYGTSWKQYMMDPEHDCTDPVPVAVKSLQTEYGIVSVWVRARLEQGTTGGRVRVMFRGGEGSQHAYISEERLVPAYPWRTLPPPAGWLIRDHGASHLRRRLRYGRLDRGVPDRAGFDGALL